MTDASLQGQMTVVPIEEVRSASFAAYMPDGLTWPEATKLRWREIGPRQSDAFMNP